VREREDGGKERHGGKRRREQGRGVACHPRRDVLVLDVVAYLLEARRPLQDGDEGLAGKASPFFHNVSHA